MEKDVPYIVFESEMTKAEMREARKDRIIALLAIIILVINMAWLYMFNQYDISSESYTVDSGDEGVSNYLEAGNDGEINNGESTGEEKGND